MMKFPRSGSDPEELLTEMRVEKTKDIDWKAGKAFSLVYYPGDEYAKTIKAAYEMYFSENALNPAAFPTLRRMEHEVISMTGDLLHGPETVCGNMTTGGTESILLAVHTAREYARKNRPEITEPEIILPITAHPAFIKACHYFDVTFKLAELDVDLRVDIEAVKKLINPNTIMMVGSAPCYPYGVIDPITELSDLALDHNLLLHVDGCLGGFMLPFVRKLGHPVVDFDFSLPGVTSMSADLHKYGYSAKGASCVLYRDHELRKHQYFVYTEWVGGVYGSPTMTGTRSGGSIAAAWATLRVIGMDGYLKMAKNTMTAARKLQQAVRDIPELFLVGNPDMCIQAFGSEELNIFSVGDELTMKGWLVDRQQILDTLHMTISNGHENTIDAFIEDLKLAVDKVKKPSLHKTAARIQVKAVKRLQRMLPDGMIAKINSAVSGSGGGLTSKRTAAMYGMIGALSGSGDIQEIVLDVLDKLNGLE